MDKTFRLQEWTKKHTRERGGYRRLDSGAWTSGLQRAWRCVTLGERLELPCVMGTEAALIPEFMLE